MRRWCSDDDLGDHVTMKKRTLGAYLVVWVHGEPSMCMFVSFFFFFSLSPSFIPLYVLFPLLAERRERSGEVVSLPSVAIFKSRVTDLGVVINTIWHSLGSFEGSSKQ